MSIPQTRLRAPVSAAAGNVEVLLAAARRPGPGPAQVHGPAAALGQLAGELAIAAA